jgi:hypothetical protein
MRWAIILGALATAAIALQILIWERRAGLRRPSAIGRVALAVLAVVLVGAAVYSAHLLGIFSIPLVVLASWPLESRGSSPPTPSPPRRRRLRGALGCSARRRCRSSY